MTGICRWPEKSAAQVGKSVGKAEVMYPSVVNSLTGIPPIVGHIKVSGDGEVEQLNWRSSTDFTTASCFVIDCSSRGTGGGKSIIW